jgi:multiple sugar transport system substrate-binding protein
MKRYLVACIPLLVVLSLLLASCGGTSATPTEPPATAEPTDSPTSTPAPTPTLPPLSTEIVEIRWSTGLGATSEEVEKQVVREFNKTHPNIKLTLERADSATLAEQIKSGDGPDITGPVGWKGSNAFYGEWFDLTPLIVDTNYDMSVFDPNLVTFFQTEEGQVGLPFIVYPSAVFYQKAMFDRAGLGYPPGKYGELYKMPDGTEVEWSWETLGEVARLLTEDVNGVSATEAGFDSTQIGRYGYAAQYEDPSHIGTFWGAAQVYDDQNNAAIPDQWKAAWNWYYDGMWGKQPFIPTGPVIDETMGGNPFNSGRVAMVVTPLWYTCCLDGAGNGWELGVLPSYNGDVHGRIDADTFRILKDVEHPREAFEVLVYLTTSAKLANAYGGMPAITADQDAFLAKKKQEFPWVKNWDVVLEGLKYPDIPSAEGYMPNFNEAWSRLFDFGYVMSHNDTMNLNTEIQNLENDLGDIFKR